MQEMDTIAADLALQAILGRGPDFVGGIDNEALDFSQLEDFINSEGSQGNNVYFNESLATTQAPSAAAAATVAVVAAAQATGGKLLNVIVENKRNNAGHSLPESPPDSSSEHPYSPQEDNGNNNGGVAGVENTIYTQLNSSTVYKTASTPPSNGQTSAMLGAVGDNLILGSHIVVSEQNGGGGNGGGGAEHITIDSNGLIVQHPHHHMMLTTGSGTNYQSDRIYNNNNTNNILNKNNDEHLVHLSYANAMDETTGAGGLASSAATPPTLDNIQTVYTNLQSVSKKRKLSQDSLLVKSEQPELCSQTSQLSPQCPLSVSLDEEYASSEACLSESQYQCIRFSPFQQPQWHSLCDQNLTELPIPHYRVDADKGFNFSNADDAFVCQKKNHFQITCHVQLLGDAQFVKTADGFQKICSFHIHFYGVKHDCPTQTIRVEQSQSDRSKKPFHPVLIELIGSQVTKVTVGRLHFSETTSNNMRKKGKPNPEQRYFQLVVGLHAHTNSGNFPIISHASQKIIVRASNPGQFESDVELCWQKGQTQDSIYHNGRIGVNSDRPDESLVVHGNIKVTGHIIQPSDVRAKKNIVECDTAEQLRNVQRLRVVRYDYEPQFAAELNRDCCQCSDTGVIAQEVAKVLPEAVRPAGDLRLKNGMEIDNFLVVNKERIFMENIGAVKELCKVTDNLETRIDQLERINKRLTRLKRGDSLKSTSTMSSINSKNRKHYYYHHYQNHGKCYEAEDGNCGEDEFCSNKFIQIVIVVLVIIMAFCLAAITTLYFTETSRHTHQFTSSATNTNLNNNNIQNTHYRNNAILATTAAASPKQPLKKSSETKSTFLSSPSDWQQTITSSAAGGINGGFNEIFDSNLIKRPTIGRPIECLQVDQDLANSNLCQIYCCAATTPPSSTGAANKAPQNVRTVAPPLLPPPPELGLAGNNKTTVVAMPTTVAPLTSSGASVAAAGGLLNLEANKNRIATNFHSNDIDKQVRQKRNAYELADDANSFDANDDHQFFTIIVQGRNFNTTLTQKYLSEARSTANAYNYSYDVPISKYMPDDFVNLIFRRQSSQSTIKEIEHCSNTNNNEKKRNYGCYNTYDENVDGEKSQMKRKVDEHTATQTSNQMEISVIFEVDMIDFQSKLMTYRASLLRQSQSTICKLAKMGSEFIEYNFHFYRHCDE